MSYWDELRSMPLGQWLVGASLLVLAAAGAAWALVEMAARRWWDGR